MREAWLRRYLRLRNRIPGHDTIRWVFEVISPQVFGQCPDAWMHETCPAITGRVIAIDWRRLRSGGKR
ncbi:MAG: transposase family protein [Candidatus Accumulibacter sp.]|nr:transposase family protein [Accumulibacter sp.]